MTNVLHMCAGIDGAGLGLGLAPTWVAEIDPAACAASRPIDPRPAPKVIPPPNTPHTTTQEPDQ